MHLFLFINKPNFREQLLALPKLLKPVTGIDILIALIIGGAIPDAAAIHAARKKREAARAKGEKEDFIPIKDAEKKSKRGPRLLREEDEDDDEERISFTVKEKAREDEYHKKVGKTRESQDDSDSDPEWEKMQISKAINNQQVGS